MTVANSIANLHSSLDITLNDKLALQLEVSLLLRSCSSFVSSWSTAA